MEIIAVRHAPTPWNEEGRIQGNADIPLDEAGREIAHAIAQDLKRYTFDRFYTSDLSRAQETAAIIAKTIRMTPASTAALRELDYGTYEGKLKSEIDGKPWDDIEYDHDGGESFTQLKKRIEMFLAGLSGERILLVTHGGCIRALYSIYTGKPLQEVLHMRIPHAGALLCKKDEAVLLPKDS